MLAPAGYDQPYRSPLILATPRSKECRVPRALSQVARVLRDGGRFLSISFGQPHFRRRHLVQLAYGWDLRVTAVGDSFHYYLYRMQKGAPDRPRTPADIARVVSTGGLTTAPREAAAIAGGGDESSDDDVTGDGFLAALASYSGGL